MQSHLHSHFAFKCFGYSNLTNFITGYMDSWDK